MRLLLDSKSLTRLVRITATSGRSYYAPSPNDSRLALLVSRCGGLVELREQICDAQFGWDDGTPGFVFHEHRRHTKITLYRVLRGAQYDTTLSAVLDRAPKLK